MALPHHLSNMHPTCYFTTAGRQPLGLDLININEYAKFHKIVICPNLCYTRKYDVLCQNLQYLGKRETGKYVVCPNVYYTRKYVLSEPDMSYHMLNAKM